MVSPRPGTSLLLSSEESQPVLVLALVPPRVEGKGDEDPPPLPEVIPEPRTGGEFIFFMRVLKGMYCSPPDRRTLKSAISLHLFAPRVTNISLS